MKIFEALQNKEKAISVIGLGYVGLPLALSFARHFKVIGFDINEERLDLMRQGVDPSKELEGHHFENRDIIYTSDTEVLKQAHFHIVAVPTPIAELNLPNLRPVLSASETVGKALKPGDYVVYESTVYPGCTEEDCLSILEQESGLKLGKDFKLGYSPERINPGDKERTLETILKIVSGSDAEALEEIDLTYRVIIEAGTFRAQSIKVAEAAKVIENTQRDLNIAFMNELALIFDRMGIDTKAVIEAAGTKWNFIKMSPGLVGGHCIGVDPYYLAYKAQELGYVPQIINAGRAVNNSMPGFIAKRLVQQLIKQGKSPSQAKVLVMGITFKEDVADIRNSKVADLVRELMQYSIQVHIVDPHASANEVAHEYQLTLLEENHLASDYDAVLVAVNHKEYVNKDWAYFRSIMKEKPILFDIKASYPIPAEEEGLLYWRL
jgi:UDP-N-acetyl-D-glucosamine/UDP-N-acetyl-D-galactosamine dehydrogenase